MNRAERRKYARQKLPASERTKLCEGLLKFFQRQGAMTKGGKEEFAKAAFTASVANLHRQLGSYNAERFIDETLGELDAEL
jgi:hypothetical protein